jgi:hypothetical protein
MQVFTLPFFIIFFSSQQKHPSCTFKLPNRKKLNNIIFFNRTKKGGVPLQIAMGFYAKYAIQNYNFEIL